MKLTRREFVQLAAAMGASLAWGGSARASTTSWNERRDLFPEIQCRPNADLRIGRQHADRINIRAAHELRVAGRLRRWQAQLAQLLDHKVVDQIGSVRRGHRVDFIRLRAN